jgi:hypothetical protein
MLLRDDKVTGHAVIASEAKQSQPLENKRLLRP